MIEGESHIGAFTAMRKDPQVLRDSLQYVQQEQLEMHGVSRTPLETLAFQWEMTGRDGLPREEGFSDRRLAPAPPDKADRLLSSCNPDLGAVVLGNTMQSIYTIATTGEFDPKVWIDQYNEDVVGTQIPNFPYLEDNYPLEVLSQKKMNRLRDHLQQDPTGVSAVTDVEALPIGLLRLLRHTRIQAGTSAMCDQLTEYQQFARYALENPEQVYRADLTASEHGGLSQTAQDEIAAIIAQF